MTRFLPLEEELPVEPVLEPVGLLTGLTGAAGAAEAGAAEAGAAEAGATEAGATEAGATGTGVCGKPLVAIVSAKPSL